MLWNASATWRFLKKKEAELSAYWVDILERGKVITVWQLPTAFMSIVRRK